MVGRGQTPSVRRQAPAAGARAGGGDEHGLRLLRLQRRRAGVLPRGGARPGCAHRWQRPPPGLWRGGHRVDGRDRRCRPARRRRGDRGGADRHRPARVNPCAPERPAPRRHHAPAQGPDGRTQRPGGDPAGRRGHPGRDRRDALLVAARHPSQAAVAARCRRLFPAPAGLLRGTPWPRASSTRRTSPASRWPAAWTTSRCDLGAGGLGQADRSGLGEQAELGGLERVLLGHRRPSLRSRQSRIELRPKNGVAHPAGDREVLLAMLVDQEEVVAWCASAAIEVLAYSSM